MSFRIGDNLPGPDGLPVVLEFLLGRGGFGLVYRGRLPDGRAVAVKTVETDWIDERHLFALRNEAHVALGIRHPHVVELLSVEDGLAPGSVAPYLVMEYVEGGTLRDLLTDRVARDAPFTVPELQSLFGQIAAGMSALSARLVHRDLKPENILVDAAGQLKIADFGLAKFAGAATRSQSLKGTGTPPYMAPEAFMMEDNTRAMDVYAAGIMFFELATFQRPISVANHEWPQWARAHLLDAPPDLAGLRSDLPAPLAQVVHRMLAKDPRQRPTSWDEIGARVTSSDRGTTPAAPEVSELVRRATTRHLQEDATAAAARARRESRLSCARRCLSRPFRSRPRCSIASSPRSTRPARCDGSS
jgi:serine/threonine protein kinase